MKIKELGDYTMLLEDETSEPWWTKPYNISDFLYRSQIKMMVCILDSDLCTDDYIAFKDIRNPLAKGIIILYFKDKISDKYTVNQHVNVSII